MSSPTASSRGPTRACRTRTGRTRPRSPWTRRPTRSARPHTPSVDTDLTTDASGTFGSQQTYTGGRGQFDAATDAVKQILDWGARKFNDDATKASQPATNTAVDMDMVDGKVFNKNAANKTHT